MAELGQIVDYIKNGIIAIIALVGGFGGLYALFEGFTNDQPESKKKGLQTLIVTLVIISMVLLIAPLLKSMAGI